MPKQIANKDDFLKNKKVFTTTEARKVGLTKSALRKLSGIVCFGSFPIQTNTGIRTENIWTCDKELFDLVKMAKKLKKSSKSSDEVMRSVQRIEELVRDKLGFNFHFDNNINININVSNNKQNKQNTGEYNDK